MTRNVLPSAPTRTFSARQSASGLPVAENVVTGIGTLAASRRPWPSSTLTTPAAAYSGVNSRALAAK